MPIMNPNPADIVELFTLVEVALVRHATVTGHLPGVSVAKTKVKRNKVNKVEVVQELLKSHKFLGPLLHNLVDVSDFLFCSGRGKGESEAPRGGGGGRVDWNSQERGGGIFSRRGRGRGAGKVSAANWGLPGGGGQNIFFFGSEMSSKTT